MTKPNIILYLLTAMATFVSSSGFNARTSRQNPPAPKDIIETSSLDAEIILRSNKIKRLEQDIKIDRIQTSKDLDTIRLMQSQL